MIPHREVSGTISVFFKVLIHQVFVKQNRYRPSASKVSRVKGFPEWRRGSEELEPRRRTTKLHKPERGQSLTRANVGGSREWVR